MNMKDKFRRMLPDKLYIQLVYFKHFKRFVNFKNPKTYNEKLQWIKLYDHNPVYTIIVDKYRVKDYVSKIIGEEYIIPTIGAWEDPAKIDFKSLPNSFVLKWNHDSGSVFICKDKDNFDFESAINKLRKRRSNNGFWYGREWPYKNVKPMVIAEKYMEDETTKELRDYKFFCFNGKVKVLLVASNRQSKDLETTTDFFDSNYQRLPFESGHSNSDVPPQKPLRFEEMKVLAEKLSKGFPEIRVDFYEVNGKIYFGELTLFHFSGFMPFNPPTWDTIFGSWIDLSANTNN